MTVDETEAGRGLWRHPAMQFLVVRPLLWLDRNAEKVVILIAYTAMAGILFVEVVRRFTIGGQAAWSISIPIYMFLWLSWFAASYNLRRRSHLAMTEMRSRFPYPLKYASLILDSLLWITFGLIVIYWGGRQVMISHANYMIVSGTDDVMQWWFYMALPLAWTLILVRAVQNMIDDTRTFRRREDFVLTRSMLD